MLLGNMHNLLKYDDNLDADDCAGSGLTVTDDAVL